MKKSILLIVSLVVLCLILLGCAKDSGGFLPLNTEANIITVGNMVYIPLNLDGLPEANIEEIFYAINSWEQANPKLEIVSFQILYMQYANSVFTANFVYGVALNAKSR